MAIIGKNVIENLTTGMYEDLKIIYREYIQNAADAIDKAVQEGLIQKEDAVIEIDIDKSKRWICICDNGTGISREAFKKIMSSIADSEKDKTKEKGFRGIGRLGGLAFCDTLIFSCTAAGEAYQSICTWDAKRLREILADRENNVEAAELVELVTSYEEKPWEEEEHFFCVEMLDVTDSAADQLLDEDEIKKYLRNVAPVPYDTAKFMFAEGITQYAEEQGFTIDTYPITVNGDRLYKHYVNALYEGQSSKDRKRCDELQDVAFEVFNNAKGECLAWMWYGVSRFEKQIQSINPMRGIRLRKGNIQIGDENCLSKLYKERRGPLYFVGEVFAVHPDLIPNARRDYFNINDTCKEFEDALKPLFKETFYEIYHKANEYKKALEQQDELEKAEIDYEKRDSKRDFIDAEERKNTERLLAEKREKAEKAKRKLEKLKKDDTNPVLQKIYRAYDKKREERQEKDREAASGSGRQNSGYKDDKNGKKKRQYLTNQLPALNRKEQKLVSRIYKVIKQMLPPDEADLVIKKIQEELQ